MQALKRVDVVIYTSVKYKKKKKGEEMVIIVMIMRIIVK